MGTYWNGSLLVGIATSVLLALGCGSRPGARTDPAPAAEDTSMAAYQAVVDKYLATYAAAYPVTATRWGIHEHDHRLRDLSREGIEARTDEARALLAEIEAIEPGTLSGPARHDRRLLEHALRAELLELEEIRAWQHNPMLYNREIAGGIASLVDREFAPLAERMRAMIDRFGAILEVIRAATNNLREVPLVWAETGLRLARGTLSFLESDLPAALDAQGVAEVDPALVAEWRVAHARAMRGVEMFIDTLEIMALIEGRRRELGEDSEGRGDFRLGRELFRRKLLYEEHVDLSPEQLRDMNEAAIREYQGWVAREAARIDPSKTPAEVMATITNAYPAPDELLDTARGYMDQARRFVIERELLTLPSDRVPIVRPTPAYARTGFASMSVPGPFERRATEAYYNITTVDPTWDETRAHQHLTYFNHAGLLGITVHEAFPGHFVQLLYRPQLPSDLRKVLLPGTLVEGWAHYTEQMMVDEGLGNGDPGIRLGQLRRALQRHARWYASLALHVFDVPLEEVAARFQEIAYFPAFPALRETERGTYDPTYLYYALGRMQILELREDYRKHLEAQGRPFSLKRFHDRFLTLGLPPALAREVMLAPEDRR